MDVAEINHRLKQALHIKTEALGLRRLAFQPPKPRAENAGQAWIASVPKEFDHVDYVAAAESILAGHLNVFSLYNAYVGFPPKWNRDVKTGVEAAPVFGKILNYRDEQSVGDIKYLWEPNRHLQLTTLAQAYHLTGEMRYAEGVRTLLDSWFDQCPYPNGPNWTSSLELAIRLVNWSCTWHLLGAADSPLFHTAEGQRFKRRWLDSVYQHSHFIAGYLSRCSSANNHLFGELTGLYVAAVTWPYWEESQGWLEMAQQELEAEATTQNTVDGVNREQAVYYQHEVIDMMLMCWLVGRANDKKFSYGFYAQIERMMEFIASVMDVSGNVPMIGDADDALLVQWSQEPEWHPYRSLLATGAVLFNRKDFKQKSGHFDDKSRWLLGDAAEQSYDNIPEKLCDGAVKRDFSFGGYFLLGDRFNTMEETRLVADAGPLGYLSIAAHGHADALAFTLSAGGKELLVDPGTYSYHTQKKWRDYFRGTSAHNTVCVDGLDQSEPGGNFMWMRKATAHCDRWESNPEMDHFSGSHDGYLRLNDPVLHKRKILYLKNKRTVIVEDTLQCQHAHDIAFNWHFSEDCNVLIDQRMVIVSNGNVKLHITMPDGDAVPELIEGRESPPLGWIARRFDEKTPSPTIVRNEKITGSVKRVTVFQISID